jgi:hypothetical protein
MNEAEFTIKPRTFGGSSQLAGRPCPNCTIDLLKRYGQDSQYWDPRCLNARCGKFQLELRKQPNSSMNQICVSSSFSSNLRGGFRPAPNQDEEIEGTNKTTGRI